MEEIECKIVRPVMIPKAGQPFNVTVEGKTDLAVSWTISGGQGSGNFVENASPATVTIQLPPASKGHTITIGLSCGDNCGEDAELYTIQ